MLRSGVATLYKQPNRINSVSIGLCLLLGLAVWVGLGAWPLIAVNGNLKNELEDVLPRAYRANLLPEPTATQAIEQLRDALVAKLPELGITDPRCQVLITRGETRISVEARYRTALVLAGLTKHYPVAFNPKVETDAARVEW